MAKLAYLTVPDCVWLNLQLTGSPQEYRFDLLENCVMAQYAVGQSDLKRQARTFFESWGKQQPFVSGNRATAFAALVCFLRLNHSELLVEDAAGLQWSASGGNWDTVFGEHHGHGATREDVMLQVLADYQLTLRALVEAESPVLLRAEARTRLTGELK